MKQKGVSGIIKYIVFLALIITLVSSIIRQTSAMSKINDEITQKQEEIDKLTKENLQLQEQINESTSDAFIEKQARTRLNMIKPGEKVVIQKDN